MMHHVITSNLTRRLTVCVTRLGWERGSALETGFRPTQKKAQKRGAYPKSGARCVGPRLGKCVPKGVLSLHYRQQYVIGLLDRHYPSAIEVHTDRECDGMSLGRNS